MKWPTKETQVAAPVVDWLREMGWDVYQEVEAHGRRADIVARRGALIWVVEVKRSLDLTLLAQGRGWLAHAHRVSLAYAGKKNSRTNSTAAHYARTDGLGLIEVSQRRSRSGGASVHVVQLAEVSGPALRRSVRPRFKLTERQKTYAEAGNADGKFWSPFKQTCERVVDLVARHPGLTIREVVDRVDHHYASKQSARGSLLSWARAGKLQGVIVRGGSKAEGAMRLYPVEWSGPVMGPKLLRLAVAERQAALARELLG